MWHLVMFPGKVKHQQALLRLKKISHQSLRRPLLSFLI